MNPKYQMVAETLRDEIRAGKYQKTLPTEQALCAQFQVSRQTVRQALSLLESCSSKRNERLNQALASFNDAAASTGKIINELIKGK